MGGAGANISNHRHMYMYRAEVHVSGVIAELSASGEVDSRHRFLSASTDSQRSVGRGNSAVVVDSNRASTAPYSYVISSWSIENFVFEQ